MSMNHACSWSWHIHHECVTPSFEEREIDQGLAREEGVTPFQVVHTDITF